MLGRELCSMGFTFETDNLSGLCVMYLNALACFGIRDAVIDDANLGFHGIPAHWRASDCLEI